MMLKVKVSLACGLAFLLTGTAAAQPSRPVVVVRVETGGLPVEFNPVGLSVPQNIKKGLEITAVERLKSPFPLFAWVADHDPARPPQPAATLTIELAKELGITWRIFLACTFTPHGGQPQELDLADCGDSTLYQDGESYPSPFAIEQHAIARGRTRLTALTAPLRLGPWRQQLIHRVVLADDLLLDEQGRPLLVLPLLASDLQADRRTVLRAELLTKLPGKNRQRGYLDLRPGGAVLASSQIGLEECSVEGCQLDSAAVSSWSEIEATVKHREPKTVVVTAAEYVKRDIPSYSLTP